MLHMRYGDCKISCKKKRPCVFSKFSSSTSSIIFMIMAIITMISFVDARSERDILEEFYKSTEGPRWKKSTGWMDENTSICDWYGIECTSGLQEVDMGVENIILRGNTLIGAPTSQIFELPFLKRLVLPDNFLTDFTFDDIDLAVSLKKVDLSNNGIFSVKGISAASPNLVSIHLSDNKLSGPIDEELLSMRNVTQLHLDNNRLTSSIPSSITNLASIEILKLNANSLTGTIPDEVGELMTLKELYLGDNFLIGGFPSNIDNLRNLEILSAHRGTRNEEEGKKHVLTGALPAFAGLASLKDLELSGNSFTGKIPSRFLKDTEVGAEKVIINLHDNELTGTIPVQFGDRFDQLFLDVTGNYIEEIPSRLCKKQQWMGGDVGVFGCDAILCPLGAANSEGRQTTANSTCTLCPELSDATYLGHTECFVESPKTMNTEKQVLMKLFDELDGENWSQNTNWKDDDVNICDWFGVICKSDSDEISSNNIDSNLIDDMNIDDQVIGISLASNRLIGSITEEIFQLPSLIFLDVSRNAIDFPLDKMGDSSLAYLILSSTNTQSLEGLSNAPLLRILKADKNQMTGPFPKELLNVTSLHVLDLSFNFFTGTLPRRIDELAELKKLRLYGNNLVKSIPTQVGKLSKLTVLDIAENDFSGHLPTELNNLINLQELSIHQTARHGPGLDGPLLDFSNLRKISKLELDSNEFTGEIPESFLSGVIDKQAKITVGLSWNNLRGTVPASLDSFKSMNIELVGNEITGIALELCDNEEWMDGLVAEFNCDAILCPSGKFNGDGLVWNKGDLCKECPSAEFYGTVHCEAFVKPNIVTERDILETLFYSTGGRTWNVESNWTVPWIPVCSWKGISCSNGFTDADDGVEMIDLENFGLVGSTPSDIFGLRSLKSLNLRGNEVDFTFEGIANATSLQSLVLAGTGLASVEGIQSAMSLRDLDLSKNMLTGKMPTELFLLADLKSLDISFNRITGTFPSEIGNLAKLKDLNCFQNMFSGDLPRSMKQLSQLKTLNFGKNELIGPFPRMIHDLSHLEIIDFSEQKSDGGISGKLLNFASFPNLQSLDLSMNSLTGTIPNAFLSNSTRADKLVSINLSRNKLTGTVPKTLVKFSKLTINLVDNLITEIPTELCDSDHSKWMDGTVSDYQCDAILCPIGTANVFGFRNSAEAECVTCASDTVAPYMGSTKCLSTPHIKMSTETNILIDFYKNAGGLQWKKQTNWLNMDVKICEWYGVVCASDLDLEYEGVVEIRLPNNNLQESLPSGIFNLQHLKVLDVSNNGRLDVSLSGLVNATNLELLVLPGTKISSLEGIGGATNLRQLNVAGNLISGPIPDELFDLINMERLYLSNNKFDGAFNPKIANLTKLRRLYCANNKMVGSLPSEIGLLGKLEQLDLSDNKFSKHLPDSLGNLVKLRTLNLAKQRSPKGFSGLLPDFRSLKVLTSLSLEGNTFSGAIPVTLLADSTVKSEEISIDLSFNSLEGAVPIELAEFSRLDINLVGNQITDLPSALCDEDSQNFLWINGNVGLYRCPAILCPAGQYSPSGRQENLESACLPCPTMWASPILGNTQCDSTSERAILINLFETNEGENWIEKTNWNQDTIGICQWYGISCSSDRTSDDEGVISIDLSFGDDSGIGLIGEIPAEIFDLPLLQILNLKGNSIDIDFSTLSENDNLEILYLSRTKVKSIEGINALRNIKELHLTDTHATGDIDNIFELKLLEEAYISYNHFSGSLSRIGELLNLVRFFAINNDITGFIPPTIGALTKLNTLALSGNFIGGRLTTALNNLPNLEEFAVLNNPERGPGLTGPLPNFAGTKMRQLVLNHNSLTGSIPKNIFQNTNLDADGMMMWVSFNQLTGAVPLELDRFNTLDLRIEGNQITFLPSKLCDVDNSFWMQGNVGNFGCDAIACSVGTFNKNGRQVHADDPCLPCGESGTSRFLGSLSCDPFSERFVLKILYLATGGATWDNNGNWTSDSGICNWYGISCISSDDDDSGVIGVDLPDNKLVGMIPSEIFMLPHLKHLNLPSNDIDFNFQKTPFPKSLTEIGLSRTDVSSLAGIGNAKSLKKLHFVNAKLEGAIPDEVFSLEGLTELSLSHNELSGTLSSQVGNLISLKKFELFANNMHGSLPTEIGKLTELTELILSENDFTGNVPAEFDNLVNLVHLSMYTREGSGIGLSGQLPAFATFTQIEKLILDYNFFTGTIPETFLATAHTNKDIEIGLSWNHLTGEIPKALDRFKSLDIALVGNMFSELPKELCNKKHWMGGTVEKFSCDAILCPKGTVNDSGRQSFDRDPCEKCEGSLSTTYLGSAKCVMSEIDILQKLYAQCDGENWNNRDGWGDVSVDLCQWDGISCGTNGRVNAILLGSNNLRGIPPKEIFDLPDLTSLWLYSNPIIFSFRGIKNARKLDSLLLDSTGLDDLDGLEDATHLTELGLRFNQMTGSIPTQLSNLKGLKSLSLSENLFTGLLPTFLEKLTSLEKLRLGSNMLSGTLLEFRNLQNLYSLDLSSNQLTGTIPRDFLVDIPSGSSAVVDLSSNSLSGEIPASLAHIQDLTLYVRDNEIDNIPAQLCKQRSWNDGTVSQYGCEAILCPPGTYNDHGRQKSSRTPCIACGDAEFYGSVTCENVLADDVIESSSGKRQYSSGFPFAILAVGCLSLSWSFLN